MTITCEADQTWSGMPEEPRECQAICDILEPEHIGFQFEEFLQNPNDTASYDCTNGDFLGSECTVVCPPGFEQYTSGKYGPKTTTTCKKRNNWWGQKVHLWWPEKWSLTNCAPIGYYDEN